MTAVHALGNRISNWSLVEAQPEEILQRWFRNRTDRLISDLAAEALSHPDLPGQTHVACKIIKNLPPEKFSSAAVTRLMNCLEQRGVFKQYLGNPHQSLEKLIVESLENGREDIAVELIRRCKSTSMAHFMCACELGRLQVMQALVDQGLNINQEDEITNKNPPLHQAMRFKQNQAAEFLLRHGALANRTDDQQMTPLHLACCELNVEAIRLLLAWGANVNAQNKHGNAPLHYAFKIEAAVQLLLDAGAHVNIANGERRTPLHEAAGHSDAAAQLLLARGANPLEMDSQNQTPIDLAINQYNFNFLKLVLPNSHGLRLLVREATRYNFYWTFQCNAYLLANDQMVNPIEIAFLLNFGNEPIRSLLPHLMPERMTASFLQLCQKYPAYLDRVLILACRIGHPDSVRLVLSHGANVNVHNIHHETPLHLACTQENPALAQLLLEHHAAPDAIDSEGNAPIHIAARKENAVLVELLLAHRASPDIQDRDKKAPLHLIGTNPRLIDLLLKAGASLETQDKDANTPLHAACLNSHEVAACLLFQAGASLLKKNSPGETPIQLAISKNLRVLLSEAFAPFGFIQGLLENIEKLSKLESELIAHADLLMDGDSLEEDAIILEVPLLLQSPELLRAILSRLTVSRVAEAYARAADKYSQECMQFLYDCRYLFNKDHMLKGNHIDVDIPDPPDIDLNNLLDMYQKINFVDPGKPGYRNPLLLKDDGCDTDIKKLKEGLQTLVTKTINSTPHLATPPQDSPELEVFFGKLRKLLKHLAHALNASTDEDIKASILIDLAVAGCHCGIRWMSESHQLYNLLCRQGLPLSLEERLLVCLRNFRLGIIMEYTEGNPHHYNQVLAEAGEELGLTGAITLQGYTDPYNRWSRNTKEFTKKFNAIYIPPALIDICQAELERLYHIFETRDLVVDWFCENMPSDWHEERYRSLQRSVERLMHQSGKDEDIRQMLKKRHIYLGEDKDPLKAIERERKTEYLALEVFQQNAEGEPTSQLRRDAVIGMLLQFNILQGYQAKNTSSGRPLPNAKRIKRKHE